MATPQEIAAAQVAARAAANGQSPLGMMGASIANSVANRAPLEPGFGASRVAAMQPPTAVQYPGVVPPVAPAAAGVPNAYQAQVRAVDNALPGAGAVAPSGAPVGPPNVMYPTAGNIVIDGRDASGKANSFSGVNVGGNAAYVAPNGQATTTGGAANAAGIGPVQTRNPTGAGAIVPAALTAGAPGTTGTAAAGVQQPAGAPGAVTSPNPQTSAATPTAGGAPAPVAAPGAPAPIQFGAGFSATQPVQQPGGSFGQARTVGAPDTTDSIHRANAVQDQQLALASQALNLASTGNLSDAIMAKHIRSTIAALSGVSSTRAGAVNPLQQSQQQAATTERDTDVMGGAAKYGHDLAAGTTMRGQDIDSYFKMPAHLQAATMAQLQSQAAGGGPNAGAALDMMRRITLAQDKSIMPVRDMLGTDRAMFQGGVTTVLPTFPTGPGEPVGAIEAARRGAPRPSGQ